MILKLFCIWLKRLEKYARQSGKNNKNPNRSRAVGYETQFEQSKEEFEDEVADILWQLNKLCWVHKINLEEVFLRKLEKNADR